jgi:subtilisin-like proprotein convertase family protein
MKHRVNKAIPDLGATEAAITFPLDVTINEIEVGVEIKHTYCGDLRLTLISP